MSSSSAGAKPLQCPICGKASAEAYKPFCSKRCADIDLARWFTGAYGIAGREDDEDENEPPADGRDRGDGKDDEV